MAPNAWAGGLSAHVPLVSLNPSAERTRHLGRHDCPQAGGPGAAVSDCLRQSQACPNLSLHGLHCNPTAVNGKSRNSLAWGRPAFKPPHELASLGSQDRDSHIKHLLQEL